MRQKVGYQFGQFHFDPAGLLLWRGKEVRLPPKEAGVLRILLQARVRNPESIVTKEEFLEVWPEYRDADVYFDNCLKRAVSALRKVLRKYKDRVY